MRWLPYERETIVLPYSVQEAEKRIQYALEAPLPENWGLPHLAKEQAVFTGWCKNGKFSISRGIKRPESFLPLIIGEIEKTSTGSILFARYSLFSATKGYLIFWTILAIGLTILFVAVARNYLYGSIAAALAIVQYVVAVQNFGIQLKISRKSLQKVLFS